jgi:ABC-type antimicrobial peptide transport system permease subunit
LLDPAEAAAFQDTAMEAARTMPGVKAAGWVTTLPLGRAPVQSFQIQRHNGFGDTIEAEIAVVSRGYLEAIRTTVVEGRSFSAEDAPRAAPVVIVNEILARRFFGRAAAGRYLRDPAGTAYRIVGVTRAERFRTLQRAPEPMVYFPLSQRPAPMLHLIARMDRAPSDEPGALGVRLAALHPRAQVLRTFTLRDHLTEALTLDRLTARAVLVCAVGALFLAMVGVYGVVGDVVRRRIPEFALRRALGAGPLRIARLVAVEALHLVAAGTLTGFALVLLAERLARAVVHGLLPVDVPALASIPLALAVVVSAAIVIPVRRAMSVAPSEALRAET